MNSRVFYGQVMRLLVPCSLAAASFAWLTCDWLLALAMFIGTISVGTLRLAASLSYSRFGSHSVGINGLHALIHLVILGISIPSASSVFCSLAIFLNSNNSRLSWAPVSSTPSLGQLIKDKLLGCAISAGLSGFLPTLSFTPLLFNFTLECMALLCKTYLLPRFATRVGNISITKPDHPLTLGEPLSTWLELYATASAQTPLEWLPALTEAPEDLKIILGRLNCSDLSSRIALLLSIAETRTAAGIAAERELRTLKERHTEVKMMQVAADPDRLRLRLKL